MAYTPTNWQTGDTFTAAGANRLEQAAGAAFNALTPGGYDIIIAAGQSNMAGRGTPYSSSTDPVNPLIFQWGTHGTLGIKAASEPLDMNETPSGIGPALQFARWYAARRLTPGRKVLIVPVAKGGTRLSSSAVDAWRRNGVAGNLYANMITQTQAALAAAGADARIVATLWLQGESDGDSNTTGIQYQTDLDALIAGLRTDLGIPTLPFIIGTMVPEYLTTGTRSAINAVHRDTPNRLPYVDVAVSAAGANLGDGNHFNAAGQRLNGKAFYDAYERVAVGLLAYSEASTPTPPATITDSFNRADNSSTLGSTDTGQAWVTDSSVWGIVSNSATMVSGSNGKVVVETSRSNGTVQATLKTLSTGSNHGRLLFRSDGSTNFWMVQLRVTGGVVGKYQLYKSVAGTLTQVGSDSAANGAAGDVVRVTLSGDSIAVAVNGATVISVTDSFNNTATKHGLAAVGNGPTFDDFSSAA